MGSSLALVLSKSGVNTYICLHLAVAVYLWDDYQEEGPERRQKCCQSMCPGLCDQGLAEYDYPKRMEILEAESVLALVLPRA